MFNKSAYGEINQRSENSGTVPGTRGSGTEEHRVCFGGWIERYNTEYPRSSEKHSTVSPHTHTRTASENNSPVVFVCVGHPSCVCVCGASIVSSLLPINGFNTHWSFVKHLTSCSRQFCKSDHVTLETNIQIHEILHALWLRLWWVTSTWTHDLTFWFFHWAY